MGCSTFEGDPPLSVGCGGCDFAHLPGMLCREQRTALTTAKARSETKRDLGQVTLRLTAPVQPASVRALEGRRKNTPTCDNQVYSTASTIFESTCCSSKSSSSAESCRQSKAPGSTTEAGLFPTSFSSFKSSSATSSTVSTKRSSHKSLKFYCPKLSEVILWGCLLGLMQSAYARAAPTRHPALSPPKSGNMEVQNGAALWINPCGIGAEDLMPQDAEIPNVSDKELLNQIVVQAKNALSEAERSKVEYVKKTFKVDYDEHHKSWKQQHYDWLPSHEKIPKYLGEEVPADHLKKIENNLDGTLADSYEYLQTFAVGLEQVSRDQRNNASPFKELFNGAEYKLRAVLCEIQVAIIERNAERRPDITRDIMSDDFRNLDDSFRNLRDWFIYRDYMNALEYVIKVFEFYSSKMP